MCFFCGAAGQSDGLSLDTVRLARSLSRVAGVIIGTSTRQVRKQAVAFSRPSSKGEGDLMQLLAPMHLLLTLWMDVLRRRKHHHDSFRRNARSRQKRRFSERAEQIHTTAAIIDLSSRLLCSFCRLPHPLPPTSDAEFTGIAYTGGVARPTNSVSTTHPPISPPSSRYHPSRTWARSSRPDHPTGHPRR